MKDECNKYGTVVHTHVDKNSKVGTPSGNIHAPYALPNSMPYE